MDALIVLLVGALVFYSMLKHGKQMTQNTFLPIRAWGKIVTIFSIILILIFIFSTIRFLTQ